LNLEELIHATRKLRAIFQEDRHRPRYHFVAPEGFCLPFDPNGAIFWRGRYHLFYIVQIEGKGHCWGHASSIDLLHWRIHPTALVPGDGDEGIYSGCALLDKEGVPTIIYLGVNAGICIARSVDENLIHWVKDAANPVISIPREGTPEYTQYRVHDPHVWLERETYYAILNGLGPPSREYDTAYLFKSQDLIHWEYLSPFYEPNPSWTGPKEDCACPDFFQIGDTRMLLCISHYAGARYYLGRFENEKFYPERHVRMNWPGGTMFAPESLLDGKGRRIFWGWVCPGRSIEALNAAGWSGVMSMPRVLSIEDDGTVSIGPVKEIERLRINPVGRENVELADGVQVPLEEVRGTAWELALDIEPGNARRVGIRVCCSPDGAEQTEIVFDPAAGTLSVDISKSSLSTEVFWPYPWPFKTEREEQPGVSRVQTAPFSLAPGETLKLRVFLDGSILEVFANNRQCITQRIYPTRKDSTGVLLFSQGGSTRVRTLQAWEMAATNPW